ncbi:MAG TPA: M20/M25/M40 family metallo-hydrolase, partial [Longimicrobiales bacterium]
FQRQDAVRHAIADAGALAILDPSRRAFGVLEVDGDYFAMDPKHPIGAPEVVLSQEQYGTIWRDVEGGTPVQLELNVQNRFVAGDGLGYNTLGDIAGGDLADQYVMLGGHLDSWHAATGATDDGAGAIVMLEAMRMLKALDLHPRRTIRIALWDGEEQGLLGSRGWVARHPDLLPKISAYVNVDNGAGRLRGICDQHNEPAGRVFDQIFPVFHDLGMVTSRRCESGGVDSQAFEGTGVPAFNFTQDPLDYGSKVHHSDVDSYERLPMDDLKQAAVVVAATVWELANRDEMMPRQAVQKAAPEKK